jgi:hypothetical protein
LIGISQLFSFESIYAPTFSGGTNPYGSKIYVYLPSFAIINGIILLPEYTLIKIFLSEPSPTTGSVANIIYIAFGLLVTGFWSYISVIGIPYVSKRFYPDEYTSFWSVIIFTSLPLLWFEVFLSGVNSLVALLALAGIWYVTNDRWLLAGVVVGLSTFKFNGLPFGIVLFLYAVFGSDIKSGLLVALGGIISQVPNIVYFAMFPQDLQMIIARGGALSAHAHTLQGRPLLNPIVEMGATDLYITYFPVIILLFSCMGAIVALKFNAGLPAGFAIGFFSTSFLVPGEQRLLPFVVLLLFITMPLLDTDYGKVLVGLIVAVTTYWKFAPYTQDSAILGLTSAEHTTALGISDGLVVTEYSVYLILPIIFIIVLILLESKSKEAFLFAGVK